MTSPLSSSASPSLIPWLSPSQETDLRARAEVSHALFTQTVTESRWIGGERWNDGGFPHRKQQQFLFNFERELFFGGAGGGGKSQAAWYGALQFVGIAGYAALIFRRTYADLSLPKALMSRAKAYLGESSGAVWNEGQKTWTFPSGATITFAYLESENDKYRYASAEFQYIFFDELTQFTESQYTYLFTRLRRSKFGAISQVPLRMRSASNPGGPGHSWVKNRFVDSKTRNAKRVFIPASMKDNPTLDIDDYKESLSNADPLTRKQIEDGDWDAVSGGRFKKEWFELRYTMRGDYIVLARPGVVKDRECRWQDCDRFMTVDPAASEKTTSDWTVALVWLKTPWNELLLWDGIRFQAQIPDIIPRLESLSRKWACSGVWIETVAANNGVYAFARRTTMPAKSLSPMGLDKLVRATPAMNLASDGRVWLPVPGLRPTLPLEDIESEWYRFTGDDKKDAHDDAVDCTIAGTMIRTSDGLKPVEEVAVGDWVLTHQGRFRRVTQVMNRLANRVYRISVVGRQPLTVTGNHRFLAHGVVRRNSRCGGLDWGKSADWVSVDDGLKAKSHGLAAVWDTSVSDVQKIDLFPFAPTGTVLEKDVLTPMSYGGTRPNPRGHSIPRRLLVDEGTCRMMGYYAAEGSCGAHQIRFASSVGEAPLHAMVEQWAARSGLPVGRVLNGGGMCVYFGSMPIRNWFASFGKRAGKHLPHWAMTLPRPKQMAILLGYLAGDGHYAARGIVCNTISGVLATQLYEISCRLGLPVTLRKNGKKNGRDQYTLRWSPASSKHIVAATPAWMIVGKVVRWAGGVAGQFDQTHVRIANDRLLGRIRKIEVIREKTRVYNLAVEEDESYVANGTVVHNCLSYAANILISGPNAAARGAVPTIMGGKM